MKEAQRLLQEKPKDNTESAMSFNRGPLSQCCSTARVEQGLVPPHVLGFLPILELWSPSGSVSFCGMLFVVVSALHMDCKLF